MYIYKTKSKMFGYQIGLNNGDIYVGVAKKYFDGPKMDGIVKIICDGVTKKVLEEDKVSEATFVDKFNGKLNYTLYYFLWKHYED